MNPYDSMSNPVQVVGSKSVWLAPPQASGAMHPFPKPSPSEATPAQPGTPAHPAANQVSPSMSNTSQIDVFADSEAPANRESPEFQEFAQEVIPQAMSATLMPGDMLFFPPGWWHAFRSESHSFSVSIWF